MIDQHERERVRDAIGDMLGRAAPAPSEPPASVIAAARTVDLRRPRPAIGTIAAVGVALAGLGGLFALAGREANEAPAAVPVTTPPTTVASGPLPLSEVDTLGPTDWVITTAIPEGYEYLYAMRSPSFGGGDTGPTSRHIAYGETAADGTGTELVIWIDSPPDGAAETVTIAGIDWQINRSGLRRWNATRDIGGTAVTVSGQGDVDEEALAGLAVVDEADLPFEPLGDPDDAVVVAQTEFAGEMFRFEIERSGQHQCEWVSSETGSGGGCGGRVDPDAVITIDGGAGSDPGRRPGTVDAVRSGSVTAAADIVEVEFADGTVVRVEPTDLSGLFRERFWIAGATISNQSRSRVPVSEETVAAARAYDADGELLGTAVPPWSSPVDD